MSSGEDTTLGETQSPSRPEESEKSTDSSVKSEDADSKQIDDSQDVNDKTSKEEKSANESDDENIGDDGNDDDDDESSGSDMEENDSDSSIFEQSLSDADFLKKLNSDDLEFLREVRNWCSIYHLSPGDSGTAVQDLLEGNVHLEKEGLSPEQVKSIELETDELHNLTLDEILEKIVTFN